jgi:outer membrane protein with beta-barrel domain
MRTCTVLLALLFAAPASGAVPEKGEGTITLLGGLRFVTPRNADYISDTGASHRLIQGAGFASFGYQYDEDLHFKIEGGYFGDTYRISGGDLTVKSIPILLGLDTAIIRRDRFSFYGGGGIGYLLNTGSRKGLNNEANSTAAYLALGLRWQIGGIVGLVIEDRYILASAAVDANDPSRSLNVGGNFLLAGLIFHFLQPDDHPEHP